MLQVVLVEPEIAPNTGNVARLCAANGIRLHLVGRLGFRLDDRSLRRAGLDYWELVDCQRHASWPTFVEEVCPRRLWFYSAHGQRNYASVAYGPDDFLVFGSESRGLPRSVTDAAPDRCLVIPQLRKGVRSLNLATSVGIVTYEALRQLSGWERKTED